MELLNRLAARRLTQFCTSLALAFAVSAQADEAGNRVHLSAHAERNVANDSVRVILMIERESDDLTALNHELNEVIASAADTVRQEPSIELQSFPAGTWPRRDPETGERVEWRGRQQMRLRSEDFEAMQDVMQALQSSMAVSQVQYLLTTGARDDIEDDLIREALLKIRRRSSLVALEMGMRAAEFASISIDTGQDRSAPEVRNYTTTVRSASTAISPPTLEAGSSTVRVSVRAEVRLVN